MSKVYLGLGSNLGEGTLVLNDAVARIRRVIGRVECISPLYGSEPWGFESEHIFTNQVIMVDTMLAPHELLRATQEIEREMGRQQKTRSGYADRVIDIDILSYDSLVFSSEELDIPHRHMQNRAFVIKPLFDIAPDWVHAGSGVSIIALLDALHDEVSQLVLKSETY